MRLPVQDDVICGSVVIIAMVAISILSKMTRNDKLSVPQLQRASRELMQQSLTWVDMCSSHQDLAYKLQAATLATAYCNAARLIASDDDISRALNIDLHEKLRATESLQRKMLLRLQKQLALKPETVTTKSENAAIGTSINWI